MNYDHVRIHMEKVFTQELAEVFSAGAVARVLKDARVEEAHDDFHSALKGHSFKVSELMATGLYHLIMDIKKALHFEEDVDFFVSSSVESNAGAIYRLDEKDPHVIILNAGLLNRFTDEELRFVIGHEIGHLISRNAELRRIIKWIYPDGSRIHPVHEEKIRVWEKLSELSADRFGFLACPDFEVILKIFFKLSSGLDAERVDFNPRTYWESMQDVLRELEESGSAQGSSHPDNPVRLKALDCFSRAGLYKLLADDRQPDGDEALMEEMKPLVSILMDKGLPPWMHHRKKVMAAAGLMMAHVDEQMAKEELELIVKGLSHLTFFPEQALKEVVEQGNPREVFAESLQALLKENPGERFAILDYLVRIALSDADFLQEELDFVYNLGTRALNLEKKEVAQFVAGKIQESFVPKILTR